MRGKKKREREREKKNKKKTNERKKKREGETNQIGLEPNFPLCPEPNFQQWPFFIEKQSRQTKKT